MGRYPNRRLGTAQAPGLTGGQVPDDALGYRSGVKDIQQVRAWNLQLLLMQCEADLGQARGAQALLSVKSGVKDSLLSVLLNAKVHSETGKARKIGDDTARKLEKGMSKQPGWMDVDHSEARDHLEADYLDSLRKLTPSQRAQLARLAAEFVSANEAASPEGPPAPTDTPRLGQPRH
jgi:hypothetical protein